LSISGLSSGKHRIEVRTIRAGKMSDVAGKDFKV